jgi:hypothetical protein
MKPILRAALIVFAIFALISVWPKALKALQDAIANGLTGAGAAAGQGAFGVVAGFLSGLGNGIVDLFGPVGSVQTPDGSWAYVGKDAEDRTYTDEYYRLKQYSPAEFAAMILATDQQGPAPGDDDSSQWKRITDEN